MSKKVTWRGFNCITDMKEYSNGGVCIRLLDANDHSPVATATSWIPGLLEGEVAIKDYSENEGMLLALMEYEIVKPPHRNTNGFPICRLFGETPEGCMFYKPKFLEGQDVMHILCTGVDEFLDIDCHGCKDQCTKNFYRCGTFYRVAIWVDDDELRGGAYLLTYLHAKNEEQALEKGVEYAKFETRMYPEATVVPDDSEVEEA